LNWNDEAAPLNWIVDPPGELEKFRVSYAWLVTTEMAKTAMATSNDLIGFMILFG
jgi:hypothetical protein